MFKKTAMLLFCCSLMLTAWLESLKWHIHARVAELVDARDLKSLGGNPVRVQFSSRVPFKNSYLTFLVEWLFCFSGIFCFLLLSFYLSNNLAHGLALIHV